MNTRSLLKKIFTQKTRDYSYAIIFFFTFSFFVAFIIRPNLISVFSAQAQISELQSTDSFYEKQIMSLVDLQSTIEANREDLVLLQQAFSSTPQINKVLADINQAAQSNNLVINDIKISDINLKDVATQGKIKSLDVEVSLTGSFDKAYGFMKGLYDQRRLKSIQSVEVDRNKVATDSSHLQIKMEVQGFYL